MPCLPDGYSQVSDFAKEALEVTLSQLGPQAKWNRGDLEDVATDVIYFVLFEVGNEIVEHVGPDAKRDYSGTSDSIVELDQEQLEVGPVLKQLGDDFKEYRNPSQTLMDSIVLTVKYRMGLIERGQKDHPGGFRVPPIGKSTRQFRRFSCRRSIRPVNLPPKKKSVGLWISDGDLVGDDNGRPRMVSGSNQS